MNHWICKLLGHIYRPALIEFEREGEYKTSPDKIKKKFVIYCQICGNILKE